MAVIQYCMSHTWSYLEDESGLAVGHIWRSAISEQNLEKPLKTFKHLNTGGFQKLLFSKGISTSAVFRCEPKKNARARARGMHNYA